jgi:hypothetical protein
LLDDTQVIEIPTSGKLQERPDCGESDIAAANGVVASDFQVVEEADQELCGDIGYSHIVRRHARLYFGEAQ